MTARFDGAKTNRAQRRPNISGERSAGGTGGGGGPAGSENDASVWTGGNGRASDCDAWPDSFPHSFIVVGANTRPTTYSQLDRLLLLLGSLRQIVFLQSASATINRVIPPSTLPRTVSSSCRSISRCKRQRIAVHDRFQTVLALPVENTETHIAWVSAKARNHPGVFTLSIPSISNLSRSIRACCRMAIARRKMTSIP
jgi:hypothetical protein